jgi:3-hydroxyacyl-CoA dehydrogenase
VTGADLAFAIEPSAPAHARALLHRIAPGCRSTAILATTADPGAVTEGLPQPGRVVGLTLEDPDELLPRVTVRSGPATTDHARSQAVQFAERVDRAGGTDR